MNEKANEIQDIVLQAGNTGEAVTHDHDEEDFSVDYEALDRAIADLQRAFPYQPKDWVRNGVTLPKLIVIDELYMSLDRYGMTGPAYEPVAYFDGRDRYLPSILVKAGFFDSVEQVEEFRPDLVKRLTSPTIKNLYFGKKRHRAKIVVGGSLF